MHRNGCSSPAGLSAQVERNTHMDIPVELDVHAHDPGFVETVWDHVAECSLALPTGQLQVHECTGGAVLDLSIAPGTYQARILFAGLDSLSHDGLDGSDRYRIDLWPGPERDLTIAKRWAGQRAR